jgi:hypothetical protein
MTRVILTNKQTGQELPEAELVNGPGGFLNIRFDGAVRHNTFFRNEWNYREVRAFRNGDVLRRKDRDDIYVRYMYVVETYEPSGHWLEVNSDGTTYVHATNPSALNSPEWELV